MDAGFCASRRTLQHRRALRTAANHGTPGSSLRSARPRDAGADRPAARRAQRAVLRSPAPARIARAAMRGATRHDRAPGRPAPTSEIVLGADLVLATPAP
jgi:hypothetical protein